MKGWYVIIGIYITLCGCCMCHKSSESVFSTSPIGEMQGKINLTDSTLASMSTENLILSLLDGNKHVDNNNRIVDKLVEKGDEAVPILMEVIKDKRFYGRGYAGWGLAEVLSKTGIKNDDALRTLVVALGDDYPYLRMLAASGLNLLKDKRTVKALIYNFDPLIYNFTNTLKEITGKTFYNKLSAVKWWEEHKGECPEQIE